MRHKLVGQLLRPASIPRPERTETDLTDEQCPGRNSRPGAGSGTAPPWCVQWWVNLGSRWRRVCQPDRRCGESVSISRSGSTVGVLGLSPSVPRVGHHSFHLQQRQVTAVLPVGSDSSPATSSDCWSSACCRSRVSRSAGIRRRGCSTVRDRSPVRFRERPRALAMAGRDTDRSKGQVDSNGVGIGQLLI